MKRKIKVVSIFIAFVIFYSGCSNKETPVISNNTKVNDSVSTKVEDKSTKAVTDMSGRTVTIPTKISKVYGANPMATILAYTLVPDPIIGWNSELPDKEYLPEKYRNLPVVGNIGTKEQAASVEPIIQYNPDVVLYALADITGDAVDKADKMSVQMGKPVIVVDGTLESLEKTYTLLGDVFNCKDQSDKLIQYYKDLVKKIEDTKGKIKPEDKVKVYYGKNEKALTTSGINSAHALLIDMVGGVNVASSVKGSADANVSIEDVLNWQPDLILLSEANANEKGVLEKIKTNAVWQQVNAVKNKKVYTSPQLIFSWFDRPPCVNQLIGIQWLAETLYPDYYQIDIKKEIHDFYKLFYHIDLTEEQLSKIVSVR